MSALLVQADARRLPLRDEVVDCVVTSPPYFGQRDYGTASWEGGDPACPHGVDPARLHRWAAAAAGIASTRRQQNAEAARSSRTSCERCGARRLDPQLGLEVSVDAYVQGLVEAFREVARVLRPEGLAWLVLGDSYCSQRNGGPSRTGRLRDRRSTREAGIARVASPGGLVDRAAGVRRKSLLLVPQRAAVALAQDGWIVRAEVIWEKWAAVPGSQKDRPTRSHESVLMLARSPRHYYNFAAGRQRATSRGYEWATLRTVWRFRGELWRGEHPAAFPMALARRCILLGCPPPSGRGEARRSRPLRRVGHHGRRGAGTGTSRGGVRPLPPVARRRREEEARGRGHAAPREGRCGVRKGPLRRIVRPHQREDGRYTGADLECQHSVVFERTQRRVVETTRCPQCLGSPGGGAGHKVLAALRAGGGPVPAPSARSSPPPAPRPAGPLPPHPRPGGSTRPAAVAPPAAPTLRAAAERQSQAGSGASPAPLRGPRERIHQELEEDLVRAARRAAVRLAGLAPPGDASRALDAAEALCRESWPATSSMRFHEALERLEVELRALGRLQGGKP